MIKSCLSKGSSGFRRNCVLFFCPLFALLALSQPASAVVFRTWNGSTDGFWSTVANWNVAYAPSNTDVLQFSGTTNVINTNDVAGITNSGFVFLPAAGAFTLNPGAGGTTLLGGDINNQSTNSQTINLNLQITGNNRNALTHSGASHVGDLIFNGVISQDAAGRALTFQRSPGNFQLSQGLSSDGGDFTLTAANTYSGSTILGLANSANGAAPATVNNGNAIGTITLDFSAAGAPANDILYNGVATPGQLTLDGGSTLLINGKAGANNTNRFGNLVYNIGGNTVQLVAGSGGTATATFGTIGGLDNNNSSRAGTVNFIQGSNTKVTTTSANGASGVLVNGWLGASFLVNGTDWASVSSGTIVPYASYTVDGVSTAGAHVDLQTSGLTLGAAVSTIRFNQNASLVLSNTSAFALANAAILMTANVGAHTNVITGTAALGGVSGRGFYVNNYDTNPNSMLVLDFPIGNQGTAQTTFSGPGLTSLTQSNTAATGIFSIVGGAKLLIANNASLGSLSGGCAVQMDNSTLMVNSSFPLDNNGGGGLNARVINLGTHGGTIDVSGTNILTVTGVINGDGSLTKTDNGTIKTTAANTYAGNTFVKGGTLIISATPTGTGAIVVNDGATLTDAGSVSIKPSLLSLGSSTGCTNTFTGVSSTTTAPIAATTLNTSGTTTINVSGSLTAGSVYPLISFATSTGAGNFIVGTLPLGVAGNIVTNNGTNIALNVTSTGNPDVWKGNVNNNWNIATTANWFLNNSIVYSDGYLVRFDDTASLFNVNVAANVAPGGVSMTNSAHAYTFSSSTGNSIGGGNGLSKTGTNSLTIGLNYTASGGISVNAGTLVIGDGNTNGAVTASAIVDNSSVVFNRADTNAAYASGISGTGSVTINMITNGMIAYGGNNSYLGDTIIESGELNAGGSGCIPALAGGGNLVIQPSGIMDVSADLITVNGLIGTGLVDNRETFSDPTVSGLNFTVGANNTSSTFSGTLSNSVGSLNLVKTGTGTLTLTGTNYNTGTWQFNAGVVNASSLSDYSDAGTGNSGPCAVGNRSFAQESASGNRIGLWFRGGTLQYSGSTPQTTDRVIRMLNTTSSIDASGSNPSASLQFTWNDGSVNFFEGGGTRTLRLTGSNTGVNIMSLHIYDQGASGTAVLKDGTGTWYLTNSVVGLSPAGPYDSNGNSYTGPTTVSNGVLYVSTGSGDVAVASPVGNGAAGPALGTIGGSAYTVYDTAALGMINLNNTYRVRGQSLTNNGATTLRFQNVSSTSLPVSYFTNVAVNGTTTIALDDTNNLVAGNTYPLIQYGSLSGYSSLSLAPLPTGLTGTLTNDTANSWVALIVSTAPSINPNPTNITASVISNVGGGQSLVLSWPADHTGWTLQSQTNSLTKGLGTNWVDVPGSASVNIITNPIVKTNGSVFYRMKL